MVDRAVVDVRGPVARLTAPPGVRAAVDALLSAPDPAAERTWRYQGGRWDGVVHLLARDGSFPSGLVERVAADLERAGAPHEVRRAPRPDVEPLAPALRGVELRTHQLRGADLAGERRVATLEAPTASGKTALGAEVMRRWGRLGGLWLVHRDALLRQTHAELERLLGVEVGVWQGKRRDRRDVTVATVQTLSSQLKAKDSAAATMLRGVRVLVVDEAHRAAAPTYELVIRACASADDRFGLSGTVPPRGALLDMRLEGLLGPKVVVATYGEMIAGGFVARPTVRMLQAPVESFPTYEAVRERVLPTWREDARPLQRMGTQLMETTYQLGVVQNEARNALFCDWAAHHYRAGERVLVIADRVDHARRLGKVLQLRGCERQWVVDGGAKAADRDAALLRFRELDAPALLVVTPWFREGMDLPEVDVGFLCGNVESEISLLQAVGRVLRVRPDKDEVLVYVGLDGRDPLAERDYLARHALACVNALRARGWAVERVAAGPGR